METNAADQAGAMSRVAEHPRHVMTADHSARAPSERKTMSAKELIEAAKRLRECHGDWRYIEGNSTFHEDVIASCDHILATIREDDDEPVTRERLEADENWVMVDTDVYRWKDRYGVMTSYHVTLTQQYSSLLWSSTGVVVRKVKSMGHLRRLVAALGE